MLPASSRSLVPPSVRRLQRFLHLRERPQSALKWEENYVLRRSCWADRADPSDFAFDGAAVGPAQVMFQHTGTAGFVLAAMLATSCGTLTGAAVGAGAGAAVGHATGYGAGKGALIGTGVGAAAGAVYDISKHESKDD